MRANLSYSPLALVLSHLAEQRNRHCRILSEKGYDVLGFADAGSAEAWLEEDTPAVAIVEQVADPRQQALLETLVGRRVMLISPDKKLATQYCVEVGGPLADREPRSIAETSTYVFSALA